MPTSPARDTVLRYHQAWTSGDIETAMDCVADEINCRAPGVDLVGKEAFRAFIAGFAPNLTGIGDIAEFVDGDKVALFYYPRTATASTAPAAEYFTVAGGKIVKSIIIFDRLSYAPPAQD